MCVTPSPSCTTLDASDKLLCSVCNGGFFLDTTNLCVGCGTGPGSLSSCTTCAYNVGYPTHNYQCSACSGGLTPTTDGQICAASIANCQTIANTGTECETCNSGFGYPTAQTTCVACSDATVTGEDSCNECSCQVGPYSCACTGCEDGYEFASGSCT